VFTGLCGSCLIFSSLPVPGRRRRPHAQGIVRARSVPEHKRKSARRFGISGAGPRPALDGEGGTA